MSHFVESSTLIVTDLDALATAAASLGLELRRGQTKAAGWQWSDRREMRDCEHALSPAAGDMGGFEVALVRADDGNGWRLAWDELATELTRRCGSDLGLLAQAYYVQLFQNQAAANGMSVLSQETLADGRIAMRLMAN